MKHYYSPQVEYVFMERDNVIRTSGAGDGDMDMATLFGSLFGGENGETGGGN